MNIIVLKNNLKEALGIAERALGESSHLPVLKYFLIHANKNDVSVTATNLEIAVTAPFSAKVVREGTAVVPASLLSSFIGNATSDRLDMSTKDGVLMAKGENYDIEIPLLSSDDFPIIPTVQKKDVSLEINGVMLAEAIQDVISAVQYSDIRPEISGILFDYDLETVVLVGTDSFRLAEKKIPGSGFTAKAKEGFRCIIPLKTAGEIMRIMRVNEPITLYFDGDQLLCTGKHATLISRLIDGNFPDYKAIIPGDIETTVTVQKDELMQALKLVGSVNHAVHEIKIKIPDSKKYTEVHSTEKGSSKAKTNITASVKGKQAEILFNWKYVSDGLKNFKEKEVIIGLNGSARPSLIRSNDTSFLYVVMPIRDV